MKQKLKYVLFCFLWPFLCSLIVFSAIFIDMNNNLFNWEPQFALRDLACLVACMFVIVCMYFLTNRLTKTIALYAALLANIALLLLAIHLLVNENETSRSTFLNLLNRTTQSPWWYKTIRSFILSVPLFLWFRAIHNYQLVSEKK
ncbi:hypothetical protein [Candidatus Uabimicrobium sp. HlEnr_7]|uniref:hypothetical protein n=1 Tax=Candidatus Uabimicrobium helgolandensis TaxID=3095367 RepID=UPI003557B8E1